MAIYKIFPEKSATLYSYYPTTNTGLDEILELSTSKTIEGTYEVARSIIKFPQSEILDIINNKVNGASYSASLRLSLANASQIPLNYKIFCYPRNIFVHHIVNDIIGYVSNFSIRHTFVV